MTNVSSIYLPSSLVDFSTWPIRPVALRRTESIVVSRCQLSIGQHALAEVSAFAGSIGIGFIGEAKENGVCVHRPMIRVAENGDPMFTTGPSKMQDTCGNRKLHTTGRTASWSRIVAPLLHQQLRMDREPHPEAPKDLLRVHGRGRGCRRKFAAVWRNQGEAVEPIRRLIVGEKRASLPADEAALRSEEKRAPPDDDAPAALRAPKRPADGSDSTVSPFGPIVTPIREVVPHSEMNPRPLRGDGSAASEEAIPSSIIGS